MVGYIFGGSTGETQDSLERKRKYINALQAQILGRQPKSAMEGWGSVLGSIGTTLSQARLDQQEKAGQDAAGGVYDEAVNRAQGGTSAPIGLSSVPAPSGISANIPAPGAVTDIKAGLSQDPVQGVMDAAAPPVTDWLKYDNTGATRSQPLNPNLTQALGFLPKLGVSMDVFSGGQPTAAEGGARTGSDRHDHGNAADVFFSKDGRRLDWANPDDQPIFQQIVREGKAAGITGFGAGDGYMQPGSMHIGFGKPAVWGAGGRGTNAPDWLRSAFNSSAARPAQAPGQVASLDPTAGMPAQGQPDGGMQIPVPMQRPDQGQDAIAAQMGQQPQQPAQDQQQAPLAMLPSRDVATLPAVPQQNSPFVPAAMRGAPQGAQQAPQQQMAPAAQAQPTSPFAPQAARQPQQTAQAQPQAQDNGDIQFLMKALSTPFMPEQKRQVLQLLLQQKIGEQSQAREEQQWRSRQQFGWDHEAQDPDNALKRQLTQAQIDQLNRKGERQALINAGDGRLFDPNDKSWIVAPKNGGGTGNEFRFSGNAVDAQALNGLIDSKQLTVDQAQQLAAGKQVTGPNGELLFLTPQGIFSRAGGGAAQQPPQSQGIDLFGPSDATAQPVPSAQAPGAPSPQQNAIQLTAPKAENSQIPAELGARIGMGDAFLNLLPGIRKQISDGAVDGYGDRAKLAFGSGVPQEIWRKIESGRDALVRNLTGAGMPESEAKNQGLRYQISATDSKETMMDKLDGLERDLRATRSGAIGARNGDLANTPAPAASQSRGTAPNIDDLLKKYGN